MIANDPNRLPVRRGGETATQRPAKPRSEGSSPSRASISTRLPVGRLPTAVGLVAFTALTVLGLAAIPSAQARPKAEVAVVLDADGVRAGSTQRVALRVSLPPGIHVQSNKPRDPLLIATSVTPTPPEGVTVAEIVYPPATDFAQAGLAQPLAVFEQQFTIGLKLAIAGTLGPGEVTVPIRFRYQACDERTCFPPLREDLSAVVHVVAAGVTPRPQFPELFGHLSFVR